MRTRDGKLIFLGFLLIPFLACSLWNVDSCEEQTVWNSCRFQRELSAISEDGKWFTLGLHCSSLSPRLSCTANFLSLFFQLFYSSPFWHLVERIFLRCSLEQFCAIWCKYSPLLVQMLLLWHCSAALCLTIQVDSDVWSERD